MAIMNSFIRTVQGSIQTSESDVYRRQILTSEVYPRAVRINPFSAGIDLRRQIRTRKVDPRTERVKYL